MIFRETKLKGTYLIDPERIEDERGFFARTCCQREFESRGLCSQFVQCSISFNRIAGTLRGVHYEAPPHAEIKLVRCTAGSVYDVVVDLRPNSPTWRQWVAVELTADNRRMLYIPEGLAHGFQTLVDNTEVFYQISAFYHPEVARGVRWNDPGLGIVWPEAPRRVLSEHDANYPDFAGESPCGSS